MVTNCQGGKLWIVNDKIMGLVENLKKSVNSVVVKNLVKIVVFVTYLMNASRDSGPYLIRPDTLWRAQKSKRTRPESFTNCHISLTRT